MLSSRVKTRNQVLPTTRNPGQGSLIRLSRMHESCLESRPTSKPKETRSKPNEARRRLQASEADSPWKFEDSNLETAYESEHHGCLYERLRPIGLIYAIIAWIFKIPYLYFRIYSDTPWATEELWTVAIRLIIQTFFTTMLLLNFVKDKRKSVGTVLIWISRAVLLPLHLYHETGIPIFSTELITAQVFIAQH